MYIFIKYSGKKICEKRTARLEIGTKCILFKALGIIDIRVSCEALFENITNVQAERYNTSERTRTQFGNVRAQA